MLHKVSTVVEKPGELDLPYVPKSIAWHKLECQSHDFNGILTAFWSVRQENEATDVRWAWVASMEVTVQRSERAAVKV